MCSLLSNYSTQCSPQCPLCCMFSLVGPEMDRITCPVATCRSTQLGAVPARTRAFACAVTCACSLVLGRTHTCSAVFPPAPPTATTCKVREPLRLQTMFICYVVTSRCVMLLHLIMQRDRAVSHYLSHVILVVAALCCGTPCQLPTERWELAGKTQRQSFSFKTCVETLFFGKWSGGGSTPVPWYGIVWYGMEPLKGTSAHPEGLIWSWVRVRKADHGPGASEKSRLWAGAGESGGLGALRHKGVSVATGFVRRAKGGNCGQDDAPKKGLVRLSPC